MQSASCQLRALISEKGEWSHGAAGCDVLDKLHKIVTCRRNASAKTKGRRAKRWWEPRDLKQVALS